MMDFLGIKFAPLRVPLQKRLETLAAASWFVTMAGGGIIASILFVYTLACTRFWWICVLYLTWLYTDNNIGEAGGRPNHWVKNWTWWRYFRNYFPLHLAKVPGCHLDPKKNYMFCAFPHGILSCGVFNGFASAASEFRQLFPDHSPRVVTLTQHYLIPLFRDLVLSLGGISASAKSIEHVLQREGGGNIVVIMPGGAAESYHCKPGKYRILLGRRKGFVKLALRNGTPLVPVISFGETDLFDQVEGTRLRKVQEFFRTYIGLAPVVLVGRGFFQYSFGIIPQRKPVTTLVGTPINVDKVDNPSQEQIDELHSKFQDELIKLFEGFKGDYLNNSKDIHLEI